MPEIRINLNEVIKVKLTDHGKNIFYHRYDRLNSISNKVIGKPSMPKVDEDGYTTFQLWDFMKLYGVHIGMTLPNVIEPLDIVFDAPTIEPERKTGVWEEVHGYVTPGGDPVWCCSECGKGLHVYGVEHGTYGKDIADHQWVACPNCGVKMVRESY